MTQQRRRPLAEHHQPGRGRDEPGRAPLARPAGPAPQRPGGGRGQEPAHQRAPGSPDPAPGDELQLDPATIVLSLPAAIGIGQMIMDQSLDALPQTLLWAGAIAIWKTAAAPGVGRGALDWLVDSLQAAPDLRRRLGVPERLPRAAPPPRARGAWGFIDGLTADVRNLRAAIQLRRGELAGEVQEQHPPPATGHTVRLGAAAGDGQDTAAVDALDADPGDVPDIGLPAVTLEQIANLDNLWVVGPKGSGKTTLLRRLIALRRGRHWALDPHATPDKWPGCVVVGGGLAFADIDRQLHAFMDWMRRRYQAQARGEVTEEQCKAARRTVVGDEWRAIRKAIPEVRATRDAPAIPSAADRLLDVLSQGRKAGICTLVASHADTAESMGVTGEKDILLCFDLVIYLGALATERVPAAARMARPAVVFDPERGAWAQLVIGLPTEQHAAVAAPEPKAPPPAPAPPPGAPTSNLVRTIAAPDPVAAPRATGTAPATVGATASYPHPQPATPTRHGASSTGSGASPARGADAAASPLSGPDDLLSALLAEPVFAAAGRRDTPAPAPVSAPRATGTVTGHAPVSTATVTVGAGGHGGVTVNVNATATAARPASPRGRGGLDVRRRRRRATEARQADKRRALAQRYAEKKLAGWSYRKAYAELGGNSDEARAAWHAAPGPATPRTDTPKHG